VTRAAVIVAVTVALIGAAEWRLAEPAASAPAPPPPTRLQAVADEFTLTLSRRWIPNRKVRIELVNFGEDPHDLRLRRIGGTHTFTMAETLPGERRLKTFRLPVGRYRVWCAVDGHRAWGMRATLRVGRP
jgi:hypothetical protein